jgi:hypothetical protein
MSEDERLLLHYGVITISGEPVKKPDPAAVDDVQQIVNQMLDRTNPIDN